MTFFTFCFYRFRAKFGLQKKKKMVRATDSADKTDFGFPSDPFQYARVLTSVGQQRFVSVDRFIGSSSSR